MTSLKHLLEAHGACVAARFWAADYPNPEEAWNSCNNGEWLMWAVERLEIPRSIIVAALCDCIEPMIADLQSRPPCPESAAICGAYAHIRDWAEGRTERSSFKEHGLNADPVFYNQVFSITSLHFSVYPGALMYAERAGVPRESYPAIIRKHIPWTMINERLQNAENERREWALNWFDGVSL